MRLTDTLRFAAGALTGHRLRTALSVMGLAVGIAAVIALTALGEGARRYVVREFTALGTNLVVVLPGKVETTGGMPFGGAPHDLTLEDVRAIATRLPRVRNVAPISMGTENVRFGGHSRSCPILGTTADFLKVRQLSVGAGRFMISTSCSRATSSSRSLAAMIRPVNSVTSSFSKWRKPPST